MKVFKIMGLYLIAAITLAACSKDATTESSPIVEDANSKISIRGGSGYDFGYYAAGKAIQSDMESKGVPEFPLSAEDWGRYQEVVGVELDMDLTSVNLIADGVFTMHEMGLKDYMNDKLGLKEGTQTLVLEIVEGGSIKNVERRTSYHTLPKKEQQMVLAANALVLDYELNGGRVAVGGSRILILNIIGAVGGVLTGVGVGYDLCGWGCAVVGGIIGGVIGWFSGGAAK